MDLRYRPATADDWPAAWAIQRDAFAALVMATYGGWTPEMVSECEQDWCPASTRMIELDGTVVGWVCVEQRADHDWLERIVVDLRYQGRGIGHQVMTGLLHEAEQRGVPLWLSVYRTNDARRLYQRLGFSELPRDPIRMWMRYPPDPSAPPPC